ncbi:MAG: hypothetical protein QM788_13415 [Roseateles sp.]|uniref:hypothetical protein n=1 Tax=Roseateles sp. TaxID=1971397 RepID=UPI0039E900DF
MSAARPLSVPARVRRIPHVADLAVLPQNLRLHPRAHAEPVPQRGGAGRNPAAVAALWETRRARAARVAERRALEAALEQDQSALVDQEWALAELERVGEVLRHRIELTAQRLACLDAGGEEGGAP